MLRQIRFVKTAILFIGMAILTGNLFILREDLTMRQGRSISLTLQNILITDPGLLILRILRSEYWLATMT